MKKLILIFGLILSLAACGQVPGIGGMVFSDSGQSAITSPQYITIATADTLHVTNDAGTTWTNHALGIAIRDMAMSSDGMYQTAVATSGAVIRVSSDYGMTWTLASSLSRYYIIVDVNYSGQYQLAGITGSQYLQSSVNFGSNWAQKSPARTAWDDVAVSGEGAFQLASGGAGVYLSSDYGVTWSITPIPINSKVAINGSGEILYAMKGYDLYYSDDYGQTWSIINTLSETGFIECSESGSTIIVGANSSELLISNNFGVSFSSVPVPTTPIVIRLSRDGNVIGIGNTNDNDIYLSTDQGNSWSFLKSVNSLVQSIDFNDI